MSVNYRRCYDLLGLDINADWEALRKRYKHLVQQFHPDRYEQDPAAREEAEAKLRELNQAYKELAEYYKSRHQLPFAKTPPKNHDNWHFQKTSGLERRDEEHEEALGRSAFSRPVPVWVILGVVPIGLLLLLLGFVVKHLEKNDAEQSATAGLQQLLPAVADPPVMKTEPATFQYGDTQRRVLQVQGKPTRKLGDLWFYGDSSVSFQQGYVSGWSIEKGSPLRVSGALPGKKRRIFGLGSTMEEVLAIQGEPIVKTRNRWDYGASYVEFENGRVARWHSSVLRPLAVPRASRDEN